MNRIAINVAASTLALSIGTAVFLSNSAMARPDSARSRPAQEAIQLHSQAIRSIQQGRLAEALTATERAVELSPRDAGYRLLLADIYLKIGRFEAARTTYADVLELDPPHVRAGLSYALMQVALGRPQAAIGQLDDLAGRAPPADVGLAYALAGMPERAIEILESAARQHDSTPRLRQNLALSYALAGNWQRARAVAAQDISPAELPRRLQQWAGLARPGGQSAQVASLLGVSPVADSGQPIRLALIQPAIVPAETAPVEVYAQAAPVGAPSLVFASTEAPSPTASAATATPIEPAATPARAYASPEPTPIYASAEPSRALAPAAPVRTFVSPEQTPIYASAEPVQTVPQSMPLERYAPVQQLQAQPVQNDASFVPPAIEASAAPSPAVPAATATPSEPAATLVRSFASPEPTPIYASAEPSRAFAPAAPVRSFVSPEQTAIYASAEPVQTLAQSRPLEPYAPVQQPQAQPEQNDGSSVRTAVEASAAPVEVEPEPAWWPTPAVTVQTADVKEPEIPQVPVPQPVSAEELEVRFAAAAETLIRPNRAIIRTAAVSRPMAPVFRPGSAPTVRPTHTGRFVVQLGAFSNEGNAERAWQQAERNYGLGRLQPTTTTINIDGRILHRVSVSGFASSTDAGRLCTSIKSHGGECFVRINAGDAPIRWAARYAPGRNRSA